MRIVKLSRQHFQTLDDLRRFFYDVIPRRTPKGKFRVTPGRIARGRLDPGEALLFTYQAQVVFTAHSRTGLVPNEDEESQKYPNYFVVDLATLFEADVALIDIEQQYNNMTGAGLNLVHSQGWNRLPDSVHTQAIWSRLREIRDFSLPEEIIDSAGLVEGSVCTIHINAYERSHEARDRCIRHYGTICCICGFDFEKKYGEVARGLIHVHHLRSLSEIGGEYIVDPILDLRPVCPNCHAVLHRHTPPYSIEQCQALLRQSGRT